MGQGDEEAVFGNMPKFFAMRTGWWEPWIRH